jgi:hypothetical protein
VLSEATVPEEIFPSSYRCDCGHLSHFFENTIREAKAMSKKRAVHLGDSESDEHTIVFEYGTMVTILCPKANTQRNSGRRGARHGK